MWELVEVIKFSGNIYFTWWHNSDAWRMTKTYEKPSGYHGYDFKRDMYKHMGINDHNYEVIE